MSSVKRRSVLGLSTMELFWAMVTFAICTHLLRDDPTWAMIGAFVMTFMFGIACVTSVVINRKR